MRGLFLWIGLSHDGTRFTETEAQLPKETLALPGLKSHPQLLFQVTGEGFTIPNPATRHSGLARALAQGQLHLGYLGRTQARRPPGSFTFG